MKEETEMATATKTTKAPITRPQAVLNELDFTAVQDEADFPVSVRRSKWTDLLDKLYAATEEDIVPRSEDGALKFIKLGGFTNPNGARTQMRDMVKKGLGETYEFKSVPAGGGSELWGRVIEVADEG
jgi:hypothetical protein